MGNEKISILECFKMKYFPNVSGSSGLLMRGMNKRKRKIAKKIKEKNENLLESLVAQPAVTVTNDGINLLTRPGHAP